MNTALINLRRIQYQTMESTMPLESIAIGVLAKVGAKLAGGLDFAKLANARIDRRARLLEDRTTNEINADAVASDFDLATIEARTKLKNAVANAISEAFAEPSPVALRGLGRIWENAERGQWNIENTLAFAAAALTEDEPGSEPSDEWLHHFQDGAKFMSDDDLRSLWGSVLAQEIRQPGSVSKRTLGVLKTLDKKTALAFHRMRSMAIGYGHLKRAGPRYFIPGSDGKEDKDALAGVGFRTREIMIADGLFVRTFSGHRVTLNRWLQVVEYQGKPWCLRPAGSIEPLSDDELAIDCFALGVTGNEIAKVINPTPDDGHLKKLIDFFASVDISFVPLPSDCVYGQRIPKKHHRYILEYQRDAAVPRPVE